ncbi:hypothetical protein RJ639_000940 [Escallonia herrerae]|uniref:Integrase catalytic domain-containing protein n=1 Tax=Escallonia herrerae TaxID=1293975 RepID=A0AA89BIT6_9ASTE|nr:hypothetical protein RJ639_000940 [Escallonia herrerae]
MAQYLQEVETEAAKFKNFTIRHIPRDQNAQADLLSKLTSTDISEFSRAIYIEFLRERSIQLSKEIDVREYEPCWMDPIIQFFVSGTLPSERSEARNLCAKAARFALVDGVLYKKSFSLPYLKCLSPKEADYALREVHEGICGLHLGGRNLAHKILRQGYYWPGMHKEAISFTRRCDQCQKFAPLTHTPAVPLSILTSPILIVMWGMDILGPFPMATWQRRFVIVAIDYFTKWTEAEPLATITALKCEEFFWKNVVCRFGVPKVLITDNGKQFDNSNFQKFCEGFSIDLCFTSVPHPQSNGQTENMNHSLLQGLKRKLDDVKGAWVDELPKEVGGLGSKGHYREFVAKLGRTLQGASPDQTLFSLGEIAYPASIGAAVSPDGVSNVGNTISSRKRLGYLAVATKLSEQIRILHLKVDQANEFPPPVGHKLTWRHFVVVEKGDSKGVHWNSIARSYLTFIYTYFQDRTIVGRILEGRNPSREGGRQRKFFQKLDYAFFGHLVPLLIRGEPGVFIEFVLSFILDFPKSIPTGKRSAG